MQVAYGFLTPNQFLETRWPLVPGSLLGLVRGLLTILLILLCPHHPYTDIAARLHSPWLLSLGPP